MTRYLGQNENTNHVMLCGILFGHIVELYSALFSYVQKFGSTSKFYFADNYVGRFLDL